MAIQSIPDHASAVARLHARYPQAVALSSAVAVVPYSHFVALMPDGSKIILADPETGRLRIRSLVSTSGVNACGFRIAREAWADDGAFAEWSQFPVILAYHDDRLPVGRGDPSARVLAETGLYLEGWISSSELGIQAKILDGTIGGSSVGIVPREIDLDADDGIPVWRKLTLKEWSLVPMPADMGAKGHEAIRASQPIYDVASLGVLATPADLTPAFDSVDASVSVLRRASVDFTVAGAALAASLSFPKGVR